MTFDAGPIPQLIEIASLAIRAESAREARDAAEKARAVAIRDSLSDVSFESHDERIAALESDPVIAEAHRRYRAAASALAGAKTSLRRAVQRHVTSYGAPKS